MMSEPTAFQGCLFFRVGRGGRPGRYFAFAFSLYFQSKMLKNEQKKNVTFKKKNVCN